MSKLNFKKPSGESRLTENSKLAISRTETQRVTIDLPKELAVKLKVQSAVDGKKMREIIIESLFHYLNK